jgi:hypothetical protein
MLRQLARRSAVTGVLTLVMGAGVLGFGSPAFAEEDKYLPCYYGTNEFACYAGTVQADASGHFVRAAAFIPVRSYTTNTCYVHDAVNGSEVGRVSATRSTGTRTIKIDGLYGTYYVNCMNPAWGGGGGAIWNY